MTDDGGVCRDRERGGGGGRGRWSEEPRGGRKNRLTKLFMSDTFSTRCFFFTTPPTIPRESKATPYSVPQSEMLHPHFHTSDNVKHHCYAVLKMERWQRRITYNWLLIFPPPTSPPLSKPSSLPIFVEFAQFSDYLLPDLNLPFHFYPGVFE